MPEHSLVGRSRASVIVTLGLTQTLAWGSTYYLPAVMADPICDDLHVARVWFFGIFSAALLLSGLLGPVAGKLIDRSGGRDVLATTNLVFAAGLAVMSTATGLLGLVLGWALIGLGMGFGLYEAAFATVTGLYGRSARSAITGITLFAGFASTIGWPTSVMFTDAFGWRGACLAWAALHLCFGYPLNRLLVPKGTALASDLAPSQGSIEIHWTMIVLAYVFGASWFVSTAMAAHLPHLLEAMGATPSTAVIAASLVGPAQVAARLIEFSLLRNVPAIMSARIAAAMHPLGALTLAVLGAPAALLFSVLHGGGNGLMTIARGTLPLALFGATSYGLRTGLLSAPARILQGGAPLLFSFVLDEGGPYLAILLSGTLTGLAFVGLMFVRNPENR